MEKIALTRIILCTHNGIKLPKFKLVHLLRLIFCGIWHKPVTLMRETRRNLSPHEKKSGYHTLGSPRQTVAPTTRKIGSTRPSGPKRLDQTDLEMNIGK